MEIEYIPIDDLEIIEYNPIFDGQRILHGVTPFEKKTDSAYRITTVYYSLEQMWKCEEVNEELYRVQDKKTEREKKRLQYGQNDDPESQ